MIKNTTPFFNLEKLLVAWTISTLIFVYAILIGLLIFIYVCKWRLFKKAGQPGWKALIPFYSLYIQMVKISGIHWIFYVLYILFSFSKYTVFASMFILSLTYYNLAKKFNKNKYVAASISPICSGFFVIYYALCNCKYDSTVKVSSCGYFNE